MSVTFVVIGFSRGLGVLTAKESVEMSPDGTGQQVALSEEEQQVKAIGVAVKDALGGLLSEIFKKNVDPVKIDLFKHGVELIELEIQVGLPAGKPAVDFKLKIAGPNPTPP